MKKRILVVEDEPSILDNILYSLETEGFEATGCPTGRAALALSNDRAFDLAILDIGLPDMNGLDLCRALRGRSSLPVIFLTARGGEVDRVVGLEIGADDYMVKPFSPRELSARVRAVLRRCATVGAEEGGAPADRGAAGPGTGFPFRVDEERAQIRYFGELVPLSSTEFRLLRAFCSHPGRVYSRAQLMDLAWAEPETALERTVDAHVKSLRAKLRKIRGDIEPVTTHRGMGYSLKEDW